MSSEREDRLTRLRHFPDRLRRLIDQQPEGMLREAGTGGGWGALEILAYLRDWDEVAAEHVEQILAEDNPQLTDYETDLWPIERDYHDEDPALVIDQFEALRVRLVDHIAELTEEQCQRTGVGRDGQVVTIEVLIETLENHDQRNLQILRDLLL